MENTTGKNETFQAEHTGKCTDLTVWDGAPCQPGPKCDTPSTGKLRGRLIAVLILVLCATVGIIAYGIFVKDIRDRKIGSLRNIAEFMYGEVLGKNVSASEKSCASLDRIPFPKISEEISPGAAEMEQLPEGNYEETTGYSIVTVDLSVGNDSIFSLINETDYSPDILSLVNFHPIPSLEQLRAEYGDDAPFVLVLHTHGTEAFSPEGATESEEDETFRSADTSENTVAIGDIFASTLEENGINTLHIREMFDIDDFNSAYTRSAEAVRKTLEEYPSIQYIFDIHRDALITQDGKNLRPLSQDGAAQIMIVVGTDKLGANHGNWESNLSVALKLQEKTGVVTPSLVRGINIQSASFNEQYSPGYLLLEIGAAGNYLSDAKSSAVLVAKGAAEMIKEG